MPSVDELIRMTYGYYPRGMSYEDPRYRGSEEHLRLIAARERAADRREPWRAMLQRLRERFPGHEIQDRVLSCPAEALDASYSCWITLPPAAGEIQRTMGFLVSFLASCYIVYTSRHVVEPESTKPAPSPEPDVIDVYVGDTCHAMPVSAMTPGLREALDEQQSLVAIEDPSFFAILAELENRPKTRREISFDPSPDEQPLAAWIAREIEATFGYERMPPEVGKVVVPDVATNLRPLGEATLYNCLLSDSW